MGKLKIQAKQETEIQAMLFALAGSS